MKKSLYLIATLSAVLFLASCSNNSDSGSGNGNNSGTTPTTNTVDKNEGITETGIKFKGKGNKTISLTADKINAARAAAEVDKSLKDIVNSDGLCQSFDLEIIYKNKKITYEDFTGFAPNPDNTWETEYCNNWDFKTSGKMHKFDDYSFVWVTHPVSKDHSVYENGWCKWGEDDTVVIIRFGDWDGSAVDIENVIGGMDVVTVTYQIGVLDKVVDQLNNPRFKKWTLSESLIEEEGKYLNCYVNNLIPESIGFYGKKWTDTVVEGNKTYGLQVSFEATNVDNLEIRYACDGNNKPWVDNAKFLSTEKNESGGFQNWWCAGKEMLDCVPESLRQDLPGWNKFYNAVSGTGKNSPLKVSLPSEMTFKYNSYEDNENVKHEEFNVRVPFMANNNERPLYSGDKYKVKFTATIPSGFNMKSDGTFWVSIVNTDPNDWANYSTSGGGGQPTIEGGKISFEGEFTLDKDVIDKDVSIYFSSQSFDTTSQDDITFTNVQWEITSTNVTIE